MKNKSEPQIISTKRLINVTKSKATLKEKAKQLDMPEKIKIDQKKEYQAQAIMSFASEELREVMVLWFDDLAGHLQFLNIEDADELMEEYLRITLAGLKKRAELEARFRIEGEEISQRYQEDEVQALEIAINYLEVNLEKEITNSYNDEQLKKRKVFGELFEEIKSFHEKKELEYKVVLKRESLYIPF